MTEKDKIKVIIIFTLLVFLFGYFTGGTLATIDANNKLISYQSKIIEEGKR